MVVGDLTEKQLMRDANGVMSSIAVLSPAAPNNFLKGVAHEYADTSRLRKNDL
jgi:hypothetical protein